MNSSASAAGSVSASTLDATSSLTSALEPPRSAAQQAQMLLRVGQMTRSLHDNLRGLGFDKLIEHATHDIPDARDRLDYVARMTEQAAQKVLNATEAANPLQRQIERDAEQLQQQWKATLAQPFSEQQYRADARQTIAYLDATRASTALTRQYLMDIMMAQDFQDLTGQVIKKVTELAHHLEQQMVQLLVDFAPADLRREVDRDADRKRKPDADSEAARTTNAGLLNGPQINPTGNSELVANQSQVDDLLDSLGF